MGFVFVIIFIGTLLLAVLLTVKLLYMIWRLSYAGYIKKNRKSGEVLRWSDDKLKIFTTLFSHAIMGLLMAYLSYGLISFATVPF